MYSRLIRALVTVVTVPVLLSSYFTTVKTKRLVPCHVFPVSSSVFFFRSMSRAELESSPLFAEWLALVGAAEVANLTPAAIAPLDGDDALLVIDMQKDFVPADPKTNPEGGKFGVAEGGNIVAPIIALIDAFSGSGSTVAATRDYHPIDHVSFTTHGGPFPCHCVQGTEGAKFLPPIAAALAQGMRRFGMDKVFVVFKAMHEHIDSFGALPYDKFYSGGTDRICRAASLDPNEAPPGGFAPSPMGCAAAPWTGSLVMKQSALQLSQQDMSGTAAIDVDAPPDALAAVEDGVGRGLANLQTALKGKRRLFVCGLALDFCVLDTCINARDCGFDEVYMVYDAARAAHIHGVGQHGSGFLTDPIEVVRKLKAAGVGLVPTTMLTNDAKTAASGAIAASMPSSPSRAAGGGGDGGAEQDGFPHSVGPMGVRPTTAAAVAVVDHPGAGSTYTLKLQGELALLEKMGTTNEGNCSPSGRLPAGWPGAPSGAVSLRFASPLKHIAQQLELGSLQHLFLSISASPELSFAAYGGFILQDASGAVVCVQAVCEATAGSDEGVLTFAEPQAVDGVGSFEESLRIAGRLNPITFPSLKRAGATFFSWLCPGELPFAKGATASLLGAGSDGGFLYLRSKGQPLLYFPLMPQPPCHVEFVTDVEGNWWASRRNWRSNSAAHHSHM